MTDRANGPACTPGSVRELALRRRSSLSATRYRAALAAYPGTRRAASSSPVWPCSGRGLPCESCHHDSGGLLHHPFTLTGTSPAVCFLWHCLADCSGWVLPTALPCGARTFLGAALPRRDRPADPFARPSLRGVARGRPATEATGWTTDLTLPCGRGCSRTQDRSRRPPARRRAGH